MKRRCVFLDRDGVINAAAAPGEYILSWEEFRLLPGITDWIRLFNALGFLVIVVTNQRCIARGLAGAEEVAEIHRRMVERLALAGARIDDVFCCPHDLDSCDCRKPKPGLVWEACRKWDISMTRSIMIGDGDCDQALARACQMPFVRVCGGAILSVEPAAVPLFD